MGSRTAYQCDAPKCEVLTTKDKGTRAPEDWLRVTVKIPTSAGDDTRTGAFHDAACLHAWFDDLLDRRWPIHAQED